jgi:hypothetical protein
LIPNHLLVVEGGGRDDIYTKTYVDKPVNIKNYIRIVDGDNRELPIRGDL